MERLSKVWWLLALTIALLHHVDAQDDPAAPPDDDGGAGGEGDDEAWKYVEFMKTELSEKVDEILQGTLIEAKDKRGFAVLDETVTETMEQVMQIREKLLERIKALRKGEIETDPSQNIKQEEMLSEFRMEIMTILLKLVDKDANTVPKLKEISQDLLRFKMSVSNEIMRMLMLPQSQEPAPKPQNGDCVECAALKEISAKVENLIACAEKEDQGDGGDGGDGDGGAAPSPTGGDDGIATGGEPGENCMPPAMYAMELIGVNELIDTEIKNHYNNIIITVEEDERTRLFQDLAKYKDTRDAVDEVITKLMDQADAGDDKLKKTVTRSLGRTNTALKSQLKECQATYCPDSCDSCAANVLFDVKAKMNDFKAFFNNSDDDESKKDFVRTELIKYINDNSDEARQILIKKATEGSITKCEEEKSTIYKMTKAPMWMLVNTTIFAEQSEVELMVDAMISQIDTLITEYCGSVDTPAVTTKTDDDPNCEWNEFEEIKKYLTTVDQIIQDALFKGSDDAAQMTALLGFVDIQSLFDKRVKTLFEENLVCPEEVQTIKTNYMTQLTKCMAQFMNPKTKFSDLSRLQRISCTKELRTAMEDRMGKLLESELQKSLDNIADTDDGSGGDA